MGKFARLKAFGEKFRNPEKESYKKKYDEAYERALHREMGRAAARNARGAARRRAQNFGKSRLVGIGATFANFGENMGKLASDPMLGKMIENSERNTGGFGGLGGGNPFGDNPFSTRMERSSHGRRRKRSRKKPRIIVLR